MTSTNELAGRRGEAFKKMMDEKKTSISAISKLVRTDGADQKRMHDRLRTYVREKKRRLLPSSLAIEIAKAVGVDASSIYQELTEKEQAALNAPISPPAENAAAPGSLQERRTSHAKLRTARGKKLRAALGKSGLKQKDLLAKIVDNGGKMYPLSTVRAYLRGHRFASDVFVTDMAKALDLEPKKLLDENPATAVSRASRKQKPPGANAAPIGIALTISAPSIGLSADDTVTIRKGALVGNLSKIESDGKDGYVLSLRVPVPATALPYLLKMFMPGS